MDDVVCVRVFRCVRVCCVHVCVCERERERERDAGFQLILTLVGCKVGFHLYSFH